VFFRVAREGKERRRQWAQKNAPQNLGNDGVQRNAPSKSGDDGDQEVTEAEQPREGPIIKGMLPSNIVDLLAAREKYSSSFSLTY